MTYFYESTGYWDKEKQQARNHRVCIGKLDPMTGDFVPSKRNITVPTASHPGPVPVVECRRRFHGATWLFDAIGEKLGITEDLKRSFPDTYRQIQ